MAQAKIVVLLKPAADSQFKRAAGSSISQGINRKCHGPGLKCQEALHLKVGVTRWGEGILKELPSVSGSRRGHEDIQDAVF